jgi:NAD-dependent dihydropyrimidine dehydrogenase PreA subunit
LRSSKQGRNVTQAEQELSNLLAAAILQTEKTIQDIRELRQAIFAPAPEAAIPESCEAWFHAGGSDLANGVMCGKTRNLCHDCGFCEEHCECPF